MSSLPVLLLGLERGDQLKRKRETKSKWIIVSIHQSPFYLSSSSSSPLPSSPHLPHLLNLYPSSLLLPSPPPPPPLPPSQPPPFSCHLSSSVVDEVLAREKTRKLKARQIRGARSPPHIHTLTTHSHTYTHSHTHSHTSHFPLLLPLPSLLSYCIAGNFRGRKLSRIGENTIFAEKTFAEKTFANCSFLLCRRMPHPIFSRRKLLHIVTKPRNL